MGRGVVSGSAELRVQVMVGGVVVHEFVRSTSQPTAEGVRRMSNAALGWLQAWSGQLGDAQLQADVVRARAAQRLLAEERHDGSTVVPASPRP